MSMTEKKKKSIKEFLCTGLFKNKYQLFTFEVRNLELDIFLKFLHMFRVTKNIIYDHKISGF